MIGKSLDQYQVVEKLGEGAMGVVYKARDTRLDRFVAIKTLPPERLLEPDRKRRFVQEAKAASALNHANIITIYDIGEVDGIAYIAMEYVRGKTLDELIPRNGMRVSPALKYAVQIADALACAHGAGIIHRDLKPSNIAVDEQGLVKILDFGLAKLVENSARGGQTSTQTAQIGTEPGTTAGTIAYMSPEQAEGQPLDARSDIFSFGSVLYEMLTGQHPFRAGSAASTMASILREEPKPISEIRYDLPGDLEKLVRRCLRKDRTRRWQTMADIRVALADIKEESDSGVTRPVPARRYQWLWPSIAVAAMAVAAALLWFSALRHAPESSPTRVVPLSTYPGAETQPAFSPDGSQVAFVWNGGTGSGSDIYVKQIGEETALRLTSDPAPDISPAWSPDGRSIAYVRLLPNEARYFTVPAIGGPERLLAETQDPRSISWLPRPLESWSTDGRWLFFSQKTAAGEPFSIMLLNSESGETRRLTWPKPQQFGDAAPAYSSKTHSLVFGRAVTYGVCDLFMLPLSPELTPQGDPRQLTANRLWSTTPVWIRDGRVVLFSSGPALWSGGIRGLWTVDPAQPGRAERLSLAGQQSVTSVAFSPVRNRLAYACSLLDENVWRVPLRSNPAAGLPSEPVQVIASTYTDHNAQYSPDGNRIVFISSRSGSMEVWVSKNDGSEQVQLTSMSAPITGSPRWSPDGERIVFDSNIEGQFEVYTIRPNGGKPVRLTNDPADDAVASWSHDGQWIYFCSNRSGAWQIWKVRADGRDPVQLTKGGGRVAFESADGKNLFYAKEMNRTSVWKVPVQGGTESQVLPDVDWQRFAIVADGIYFLSAPDPEHDSFIEFHSFATGENESVARIQGRLSFGLSVSPDRRWALVTKLEDRGSDLMLVENFR